MGVQLVGAKGDDARLLRTARWLADFSGDPRPSRKKTRKPKKDKR
jgi:Asp-tRNA(Asn)/Glu-tRNA(Gln) amidotransferase A subunit family amidase